MTYVYVHRYVVCVTKGIFKSISCPDLRNFTKKQYFMHIITSFVHIFVIRFLTPVVYVCRKVDKRVPNFKTLRSPFSAKLSRHCVLSVGTQYYTLFCYQSKEIKIYNSSNGSRIQNCHVYTQSNACFTERRFHMENNENIENFKRV